ncbi:helix-turn-helix domain-containing protein [Brevibacillus porteri]
MSVKTLGKRVKLVRKQHNMTQVNFAKSLGISQANLSEIDSGKN